MVSLKKMAAKKILKRYKKLRARLPAEISANENLREVGENGNLTRTTIIREEHSRDQLQTDAIVVADLGRPLERNVNPNPPEVFRIHGREIRLPGSPFLPFPTLLSLLDYALYPEDMRRLHFYYRNFKAGNITRQTFVDRMRNSAGDDLLMQITETFAPSIRRRLVKILRDRGGR